MRRISGLGFRISGLRLGCRGQELGLRVQRVYGLLGIGDPKRRNPQNHGLRPEAPTRNSHVDNEWACHFSPPKP